MKYHIYLPYNDTNLSFEQIYQRTEPEIKAIMQSWDDVETKNKEIYKLNSDLRVAAIKELTDWADKYGINWKYQKSIFSKSKRQYTTEFETFISKIIKNEWVPSRNFFYSGENKGIKIDGVIIDVSLYNKNLLEIWKELHRLVSINKTGRMFYNSVLVHSISKAVKLDIDISKWSEQEIIERMDELEQKEFLEKNYPNGKEIELDDNYCECASYTMGEHRCSCGNRRICCGVEGNIVNGYHLVAEPY